MELAEKICREYLHVGYEIRLVADGKYGEKMPNGTWNGMVGELTNRVGIGVNVNNVNNKFIERTGTKVSIVR